MTELLALTISPILAAPVGGYVYYTQEDEGNEILLAPLCYFISAIALASTLLVVYILQYAFLSVTPPLTWVGNYVIAFVSSVLSVLTGVSAESWSRNPLSWTLLSTLATPLVALPTFGVLIFLESGLSLDETATSIEESLQGRSCPSCGKLVERGDEFCPSCGEKLDQNQQCPECSADVPEEASFCPECGQTLR